MNIKLSHSCLHIGKEGDITVKKWLKTADFTQNTLKCDKRMIAIKGQRDVNEIIVNHSVGYALPTGASITNSRLSKQELWIGIDPYPQILEKTWDFFISLSRVT